MNMMGTAANSAEAQPAVARTAAKSAEARLAVANPALDTVVRQVSCDEMNRWWSVH